MKLIVNNIAFDAAAQPFIGDLRLLRKEFGFGWGTVAERLQHVDVGTNFAAFLDDEDLLDALIAWIWMAHLRAGIRSFTRADAEMVPIDSIRFTAGDQDPEVEPDIPTSARTGSDPGDDSATQPNEGEPDSTSTRTSSEPSTSG